MEARSCNQSCSGKAVHVTYSEGVIVALRIERVMRLRRIVTVARPA
jgi:hypothetical protein